MMFLVLSETPLHTDFMAAKTYKSSKIIMQIVIAVPMGVRISEDNF
jgi:hypothetical protein